MEERINKYWEGKLNKSEIKQLLSDLDDQGDDLSEKNREAFQAIAHRFARELNTPAREHVLIALHRRIEHDNIEEGRYPKIRKLAILKIAATVIAVLFGVGLIWNIYAPRVQDTMSVSGRQNQDFVKENVTDKAIALRLPDQSLVVLHPASRIRWVVEQTKSQRTVYLDGKAQFDVVKDVERPFSVYNNGYVTTALGTSFIVDDRHGSAISSVTLLSGKVVVKADERTAYEIGEVYLVPGEKLDVRILERQFAVSKMDESVSRHKQYTRAKQGQVQRPVSSLLFEKETLDKVFEAISTYSGKEVVFEKRDVVGLTFTGDLGKMKSAERMLQVVCGTNRLQYSNENNHFIITVK